MKQYIMGILKRFFAVIAITIAATFAASASTQWYKATSYAYKYMNSYGAWTDWSSWITCNVSIKFEMDDDVIVIYWKKTQMYAVVDYEGQSSDGQGGTYVSYKVIDQDYDRGHIRLRVERNGNSQLYVDFADVMWVYNVVRC